MIHKLHTLSAWLYVSYNNSIVHYCIYYNSHKITAQNM